MKPLKFRKFAAGLGVMAALALTAGAADPSVPTPKPSPQPAPPAKPAVPQKNFSPLYDYDAVDEKPRPISQVPPVYPAGLKEKGVKATVMVEFVIGKTGIVEHAQILSSTDPRFNDTCVEAALKWRFTIAKKHNQAVFCRAAQNLAFE
ncbi:MAG TPA: energy transducer TonB [Lacunisphaera sp.]|nr:energy transducer TonB [Lacunisphaera sp.]